MGFPAIAIEQTLRIVFPKANIESIELVLAESSPRGFLVPGGITVRAML
jgi:hypothetical protein